MQVAIHGQPRGINDSLRSYAHTRAQVALGRFSPRITGLMLYLDDVNGPRGGEDKACRIVANLVPRGEVIVYGMGSEWESVIHATLRRLARTVVRELERRRSNRSRRLAS